MTKTQVARVCRETEGERMEVQPEFELAYYKGLQGQSIMQWPAKHVPSTWPEFFQARRWGWGWGICCEVEWCRRVLIAPQPLTAILAYR